MVVKWLWKNAYIDTNFFVNIVHLKMTSSLSLILFGIWLRSRIFLWQPFFSNSNTYIWSANHFAACLYTVTNGMATATTTKTNQIHNQNNPKWVQNLYSNSFFRLQPIFLGKKQSLSIFLLANVLLLRLLWSLNKLIHRPHENYAAKAFKNATMSFFLENSEVHAF